MSTGELKPCPFCSAEPEILSDGRRTWGLVQHNDGCLFPTYPKHEIPESDFAAWNTRTERTCDYKQAAEYWQRMYEEAFAERTCKQEERGWGTEGDHARVWLTCGHDCMVPTVQDLPNYCPNCGAKVVSE